MSEENEQFAPLMKWIRGQVERKNYQFKVHALERASERGIDLIGAREALLTGEVIEDYPHDRRGHSCLVYGRSEEGKDIHVVCGMTDESLWVITVYEPNDTDWIDPRTRRTVL